MEKRLILVDTFNFFFRIFYAYPPLANSSGEPTGMLSGFFEAVHHIMFEHYKDDIVIFTLESKSKTFRHTIYPEYKANRSEAPADIKKQIPVAIEMLKKMKINCIKVEGYEADDVIASLASQFSTTYDVVILSSDKDLYQLLNSKVKIYDYFNKKFINSEVCMTKFGVKPEDFIEYQSIVGDSIDNVKGVKGIGAKGAQKLVNEYQTLENIYDNLDKFTPRNQKLLVESKDSAFLSRELVSLKRDIDIKSEFLESSIATYEDIVPELRNYELKRSLVYANDFVDTPKDDNTNIEFKSIVLNNRDKLFKVIDEFSSSDIIFFDTETTGLDYRKDRLVGFSFTVDAKVGYYVPISHNYLGVIEQVSIVDAKEALLKLFTYKIVGHNLKFDLPFVAKFCEVAVRSLDFYSDTIILAWLYNSSSKIGLDALALKFFKHKTIKFGDVVKKGENFSNVEINEASVYAVEDVIITAKVFEYLYDKVIDKYKDDYENVELPLVKNIIDVESYGIKVDLDFLSKFREVIDANIKELIAKIYEVSGCEFNINSPKQLGDVLFTHLNLPVIKKTKSSNSTNEVVLKQLASSHEVVPLILEYREAFKLYSSFIDPIYELAKSDKNSKIYTSFNQFGTSTGRFSSREPNLQTIPARRKLGSEFRRSFIAQEGYSLISIDYSQIELRLLAHYSEDPVLLDSFNNDVDIHYATALKLFGNAEAKEKRHIAKSINFGILYGMGSTKLSKMLDITIKEAKDIIDRYFDNFITVQKTITQIGNYSEEKGYVETLLGRRRFFNYEGLADFKKLALKREAVNTKFQGSAADVIKLSMNEIFKVITENGYGIKVLLQIHDELIFEVASSEADKYQKLLVNIMEKVCPTLKVKLKCSSKISQNLKEVK